MKTEGKEDLNSVPGTGFRFTSGMRNRLKQSTIFVLASVFVLTAIAPAQSQAPRSPTPAPINGNLHVETIVKGLEHPWGLTFLPDGFMFISERPGRMRAVDSTGKLSKPLEGVPKVLARGQGGLLDVAVDPRFPENRLVYVSYSEPEGNGAAGTSVARGRLGKTGLEDVQVIYRQQPKVSGPNHFGSRLAFAHDGSLFVTQGDRFAYREQAQDLSSGIGKVVRINSDGSVPKNNPFVSRKGAKPEIWSYGHRNIQSAAIDPQTGQLWTVEHGARGGDELNHPQAGKNMVGRSSHTGLTIQERGSAKAQQSPAWSSLSTIGTGDRPVRDDLLYGGCISRLEKEAFWWAHSIRDCWFVWW